MTNIYMTSWCRQQFTLDALAKIHERTEAGSFQIHLWDNGSDMRVQQTLFELLRGRRITSLHLDSRNTGCLYNKQVFHSMTESSSKYYVVTDNDIFPPLLSPSWLARMTEIMDRHPELAFLAPQLPPVTLQEPYQDLGDVVYCKAVGNTLKMVRRESFPSMEQRLGVFGDDGLVCDIAGKTGWKAAFCKDIFCWHAGQCEGWGYGPDEIGGDVRKAGYGKPFKYTPVDNKTYEPPKDLRI